MRDVIKRFAVFVACAVSLLNGGIANADELTIPDDQLHNVNPSAHATTISNIRLDEPAILNDPINAWDGFKRVVSLAEPSGDVLFNIFDGDLKYGSSIRLYTLENAEVPVIRDLDTRLGWLADQGAYLSIDLALDRVTGNNALQYVHVGIGGGRDFQDDEWMFGPSFGAKVSF